MGQDVGAASWEREWDQNVSDEEETALRRVRFFGVNDLAAGWYVPRGHSVKLASPGPGQYAPRGQRKASADSRTGQ